MLDREGGARMHRRIFMNMRIFTLCMDGSMHLSIGSLSLCHHYLYQGIDRP